MKTRNILAVLFVTLFLSGCVVYSFYPLYTREDLFPNDILTGSWVDEDNSEWSFKHSVKKGNGKNIEDKTSYILTLKDKDKKEQKFRIHIIKLGGHYFLDFFLEDFGDGDDIDLATFHIIPVHTFAKMEMKDGELQINWFDQEWLSDLIKENKIAIPYEKNEDMVLLTAKPQELQRFVLKYSDSEEAFENGLEAILKRKSE